MALATDPFRYSYAPGTIRFGRGCVERMNADFAEDGYDRALVVTGTNVGANDAVMGPITTGLGDRLQAVFAETTPEKSFHTAYDVHDAVDTHDIDVLVGVGAGSSLDIATVASALYARYRPMDEVRSEVDRTGHVVVEEDPGEFLPLVFVPTTLTGADLSSGAGIKVPGRTGERGVIHPELTPSACYYDPDLFETTPENVLIGSAMNSFDKGVEALYSENREPITDATAIRGLQYFKEGLSALYGDDGDEAMEKVVLGGILAQLGVTVPDGMKLAVVHAMCHALRHQFGVQQGVAHGIVVPHALRWVMSESPGSVDRLAEAFSVSNADDRQEAIVDEVTAVRDSLGLPGRLRDVEGTAEGELRAAAEVAYEDSLITRGPADLDPTVDAIESVFRAAW
jgi:alcohol dehydrogenase class IV